MEFSVFLPKVTDVSILFLLLALLFALCAATVLLSGAFLWYETANRQPQLLQERLTAERLGFAARLLAMETVCLFVSILLRPLGWFGQREDSPVAFNRPPVVLLNGLFHNRGCWFWMARQLRRRGLPVYTVTLPLWHNPERAVRILAAAVEKLSAFGAAPIDVVAHSMGGLVVRQYLQEYGTAHIRRCILLAAPNHGSRLAPFAISPLGRRLLPDSPFIRQMQQISFPPDVRCTAVHSRHDNLVIPWESSRLDACDAHGVRRLRCAVHVRLPAGAAAARFMAACRL